MIFGYRKSFVKLMIVLFSIIVQAGLAMSGDFNKLVIATVWAGLTLLMIILWEV